MCASPERAQIPNAKGPASSHSRQVRLQSIDSGGSWPGPLTPTPFADLASRPSPSCGPFAPKDPEPSAAFGHCVWRATGDEAARAWRLPHLSPEGSPCSPAPPPRLCPHGAPATFQASPATRTPLARSCLPCLADFCVGNVPTVTTMPHLSPKCLF